MESQGKETTKNLTKKKNFERKFDLKQKEKPKT